LHAERLAAIISDIMAQVVIRNLDDTVLERHRERARQKGHSLEQELRELLTRAAPLNVDEKLAIADRIRAMTPAGSRPKGEDLIRQDRDRR
jgi:plasmid stability protein